MDRAIERTIPGYGSVLRQMRLDHVSGCMYPHIWIDDIYEEALVSDERIGLRAVVERRKRLAAPARCLQGSAGEAWRELHQYRGSDLRPWSPFQRPPLEAELKHLEDLGMPLLAAALGRSLKVGPDAASRGPVALGPEGDLYPTILCSRKVQVALKVDVVPLIARHAAGEMLADYAKLDADALFAPVCFDQSIINAIALHDNYGLIRSRFDVSDQTGRPGDYVEAVSYLPGPGRPVECAVICSRD